MEQKKFIFLAGLHRSGTSLLHEIIREHSDITGFSGTGVPQDEGQHLQSVYKPASAYGGPGKFGFDSRSYMDETHPLATSKSAELILEEWSKNLDLSCDHVIEKSPPNIIRTRFFQKLFPDSKFIAILRHPLAVSYATQKWAKTSASSLLEHTFLAYETLFDDAKFLNSIYFLRYEDFIVEPQKTIDGIFNYLGLSTVKVSHEIRQNINEKYFSMWEDDRKSKFNLFHKKMPVDMEVKANRFGYSIEEYHDLVDVSWLGEQKITSE